jgi:hypothetical protein
MTILLSQTKLSVLAIADRRRDRVDPMAENMVHRRDGVELMRVKL